MQTKLLVKLSDSDPANLDLLASLTAWKEVFFFFFFEIFEGFPGRLMS